MAAIVLGFNNRADASTLSGGSWDGTLVLNNLKDSNISKAGRTSSSLRSATRLRADLGANYTLRAIALAQHNLSTTAKWSVKLGTSPFDVDFSSGVLDDRLAFSGGTNGTRFDSAGVLQQTTRTNRILQSQTFGTTWTTTNLTVVANQLLGPYDGTTTADSLTETVTNAGHNVQQNLTPPAAGIYTFSVAVYAGLRSQFTLQMSDGTNAPTADINTVTGLIGLSGTGVQNGTCTLIRGGWYLLTVTGTLLASSTNLFVYMNKNGSVSYAGDTSGVAAYIADAQFEAGSIATDRIATTTVAVTVQDPRFTYDPTTLAARGIQIEEGRTNLLLWNRDGTNAAWVKSSVTAAKTATGIDGGVNSATTLTATGANGTCLQTVVSASAGRATFAWVRRRTGSGTINMTQNGGTLWTAITVSSTWTRFYLPTATITNPSVGFRIVTSGDAIDVDFVQLETAAFSTSEIWTTTAAVARAADVLSATGANFTSWFTQMNYGTFYADVKVDQAVGGYVMSVDDTTANNRFQMTAAASNSAGFAVVVGGVVQADTFVTAAPLTGYKQAGAFAINDISNVADGGTPNTDNSSTLPTVTRILFGALTGGGSVLNGTIKRFTYWPTRLTNVQLQSITTSGPDVLGYSSGLVNAKLLTFNDDTPSDWGSRGYNAMMVIDPLVARYLTVEISDTVNSSGYVQIGRLFIGGAIQPAANAMTEDGYGESRIDLSSTFKSVSGKKLGVARRRQKAARFSFPWLTQTEADLVHEMQDDSGVVDEILFVPNPADMPYSQRYGGLGNLSELDEIGMVCSGLRGVGFKWEEKL